MECKIRRRVGRHKQRGARLRLFDGCDREGVMTKAPQSDGNINRQPQSRRSHRRIANLLFKTSFGERRPRGPMITATRIELSDFLNSCQRSHIRVERRRVSLCVCKESRRGGAMTASAFVA
jgi:hypothetical protein